MSKGKAITVGVVGMGAMGLGMAATLAGKGFAVRGFDLSPERRAAAAERGVEAVERLEDVFAGAGFLVFSLPTAKDVAGVVETNQSLIGAEGQGRVVVIDTSTSEPDVSRALAEKLEALGHGFLDAPVSGGPAGAASGKLAMMIGGDAGDVALARPVIEAMAASVLHVGPSGAGNVAKLVNNLLVAAHMMTTGEALRLGESAGVGADAVLRVVNAATGRSALSEVHFPTWILSDRFDSGFTMGLMRKDVRLAGEMADKFDVEMPLLSRVRELWKVSAETMPDTDDFTRMGAFKTAAGTNEKKDASDE